MMSGGFMYTALLYGEDMSTGKIVSGGVANETAQIFANLQQILTAAGKTMGDVFKTYCMLTDITANTDALQGAYQVNFQTPPLRYLQQAPLPKNASVAIQFIIGSGPEFFADPWDPTRQDVSFGGKDESMVFTSGFVGYDPRGPAPQPVVSDEPSAQLKQAFKNVQTSVELAGGSMQSATDCQMWVASMSIVPELMMTWTGLFEHGEYPALTINEVGLMRRDAKIGLVCRVAAPDVQLKRIKMADSEGIPRSSVTVAGNLAYTSGFFPYGIGSGDAALDTQKAMNQVRAALESATSSMDKVMFCQLDVADLSDVPAIDAVYRTYFAKSFPARQIVQVVSPSPTVGSKVSIMCIGSTA
jgi:enamine deaminase RidA (YjgF/YER057c/UK114 family)